MIWDYFYLSSYYCIISLECYNNILIVLGCTSSVYYFKLQLADIYVKWSNSQLYCQNSEIVAEISINNSIIKLLYYY